MGGRGLSIVGSKSISARCGVCDGMMPTLRMIDMRADLRWLPPCRNRSSNERSSTTMLTSRKGRFGRHVCFRLARLRKVYVIRKPSSSSSFQSLSSYNAPLIQYNASLLVSNHTAAIHSARDNDGTPHDCNPILRPRPRRFIRSKALGR